MSYGELEMRGNRKNPATAEDAPPMEET